MVPVQILQSDFFVQLQFVNDAYIQSMKWFALLLSLSSIFSAVAQSKTFRFAFISDTHIGSPNGSAEEDLRRNVADINTMKNVEFVVLTGDITELGKEAEMAKAKELLDSLHIRYYIIPGNHDTGWSGSGGLAFSTTFGDDKFHFVHNGIHFIGCASGPYVRMSDGHVPRHNLNWLRKELKAIPKNEPIVFLNHYPLDNGLDNWYEVIDLLKTRNTVLALCGHGHANRPVQAEGLPAVMGRSNLRAKATEGGYNLVDVTKDSFLFTERQPLTKAEKTWRAFPIEKLQDTGTNRYPRPDYSINKRYPQVKAVWSYQSSANVISTPAVVRDKVVFGNQNGLVEALDLQNGKKKWSFQTAGPIFSSPATAGNAAILGSADGMVYALGGNGKPVWKFQTAGPVLGAPLVEEDMVYVGGSDSCFRAISWSTGKVRWTFRGTRGAVTSKPASSGNTIVFGAWDGYLYALDKTTGNLLWKWNNGSPVINYSPAACIPVIRDSVVYIAAPDRYLTAIDLLTGNTLWRTKEAAVRESIGMSEDGKLVYGKTMQDTVVAFHANKEKAEVAWKIHAGFGYEHVPSMLIEKKGTIFFGTKNGVVYSINASTQKVNWVYKIDNSMVNTVLVLGSNQLIASTMDGKVVLLQTTD
jgi:outer membrane protein assembly factor BamB/calcineurin-like phosphoesterase family protein